MEPLTLSWLHSLNLLPDDERCHHGSDLAHTRHLGVKKSRTPLLLLLLSYPSLLPPSPDWGSGGRVVGRGISNVPLPSSLCSSALSLTPLMEPSRCGLELSSSLLGMD